MTEEDRTQVTPEDAPEAPPEDVSEEPFKSFGSKEEHDKYIEGVLKERLERKDRKAQEEREKAEREAREKALSDQEDWKRLAEERTNTIAEKEKKIEELSTFETATDVANERVEMLEERLKGLISPQLERVDELYRPFVESMPVEEQAEWLEKNAEKLGGGTANGSGSSAGQRPSGSRPTGRPAPVPRAEQDKEAREAQNLARVSSI